MHPNLTLQIPSEKGRKNQRSWGLRGDARLKLTQESQGIISLKYERDEMFTSKTGSVPEVISAVQKGLDDLFAGWKLGNNEQGIRELGSRHSLHYSCSFHAFFALFLKAL